jgi:hypothetical protein
MFCAVGRTRWRRPRTPAPRSSRAFHLLPVLVREPCCSVHREPNHAASRLGEPPRWRDSNCCEPAFEPRTFFCRCLRARELAGRTPARNGHGLAAGEAQRAGVPRRVMRVDGLPRQQASVARRHLTPARPSASSGCRRHRCRWGGCAAARRDVRLREERAPFPGYNRVKGAAWALSVTRPIGVLWGPNAMV